MSEGFPTVRVWVRTSLDWSDSNARAQIRPSFLPLVDLWDETFEIPYVAFRAELTAIARLNLERVAGATMTRSWDAIPDGALVLPVDDDDWFEPDVVAALNAAYDPAAIAYRWESTFLERPNSVGHALYIARRRVFPWLKQYFICTTNNYAIVKREEMRPLLEDHRIASTDLTGSSALISLPGRHSLMNRTLASQTSLLAPVLPVTRRRLLRKHRAYRSLYESRLTSMPEWSHEYVRLVAGLMESLEPRRQHRVTGR